MKSSSVVDNDEQTGIVMNSTIDFYRRRSSCSIRECIICGSKAIGINFGAATCAPCKAFFRRNARRKEILNSPCQHSDSDISEASTSETLEVSSHYSKIRRCSSCRLRRCFDVGMKEELVRTEEENARHKQLVDNNRKRRIVLKQGQQIKENQISIPQRLIINKNLLNEIDWQHLSNVKYAYDTHCLKVYLERCATVFSSEIFQEKSAVEYYSSLPSNLAYSLLSFVKTLPAFQSLSRNQQISICKNNLRRLMLVNNYELNQSCFSESWQIDFRHNCWQFLSGQELYKDLVYAERLADRSWIADPIVTRLWIIVLLFSTPLFCYYDSKCSTTQTRKVSSISDRQNAYATLLWKYLLHRHGYMESIRIYSNLMHIYLNMLRVGLFINIRVRSQKELVTVHETLDRVVIPDMTKDS
ncbi:hypothetical protein I4U23_008818 [Adineta vaga]|nr:hypothetical protein I4U23_008818 [Adineta vaga]